MTSSRGMFRNALRLIMSVVVAAIVLPALGAAAAQGGDDAGQLSGRLGGALQNVQARFGDPNWVDTNLIGYNSQVLAGVDSIVVVYYDDRNIVNKISLVYLAKPAQFQDPQVIAEVVRQVAPMDGTCAALKLTNSSFGNEVYSCKSEALEGPFDETVMSTLDLVGAPGTYSYAVDPTADEYFEIIVQPGTGVFSAATSTGGSDASSTTGNEGATDGPLTAEEQEYASTVYDQTQLMSSSLNRFSELMRASDAFTDNWVILVAAELVTWQLVYEEALAMDAPPRFAAVHSKYLEGLGYYSQAADEIIYGIDNFDLDAIERAASLMNLGSQAILEANRELEALEIS